MPRKLLGWISLDGKRFNPNRDPHYVDYLTSKPIQNPVVVIPQDGRPDYPLTVFEKDSIRKWLDDEKNSKRGEDPLSGRPFPPLNNVVDVQRSIEVPYWKTLREFTGPLELASSWRDDIERKVFSEPPDGMKNSGAAAKAFADSEKKLANQTLKKYLARDRLKHVRGSLTMADDVSFSRDTVDRQCKRPNKFLKLFKVTDQESYLAEMQSQDISDHDDAGGAVGGSSIKFKEPFDPSIQHFENVAKIILKKFWNLLKAKLRTDPRLELDDDTIASAYQIFQSKVTEEGLSLHEMILRLLRIAALVEVDLDNFESDQTTVVRATTVFAVGIFFSDKMHKKLIRAMRPCVQGVLCELDKKDATRGT